MKFMNMLLKSAFLRQNAVVFIGAILVGVGNYLYYPVLGRLLPPAAYGEVQALVALFTQLAILLVVLGQVTVNIVANYTNEAKKLAIVAELERLALMLSIGLSIILAVFSFKLRNFFQFESIFPFLLLLVAFSASIPGAFRGAYLRARKDFTGYALAQVLGAFSKLAFSAAAVLAGFKSSGAIGGLIVAQLIAFWYAARAAERLGFSRVTNGRYFRRPDLKLVYPELKYALLVLICSGAITLLSSLDILVVKHYFDPHTAGQYAGVSAVAKIVFFLTASVTQVLLPSVKMHLPHRENRLFLAKSFGLVALLGGGAVATFALYPAAITRLLMGGDYTAQAHLLGLLALAMLLLSILNLLISYYLALRKYMMGGIVLAGTIFLWWLVVVRHNDLQAIVTDLIYGTSVTLGLLVAWRLGASLYDRDKTEAQATHIDSGTGI